MQPPILIKNCHPLLKVVIFYYFLLNISCHDTFLFLPRLWLSLTLLVKENPPFFSHVHFSMEKTNQFSLQSSPRVKLEQHNKQRSRARVWVQAKFLAIELNSNSLSQAQLDPTHLHLPSLSRRSWHLMPSNFGKRMFPPNWVMAQVLPPSQTK